MTQTFDRLMVKAGFDMGDVQRVKGREFLYIGILSLLGICGLFLGLLVF